MTKFLLAIALPIILFAHAHAKSISIDLANPKQKIDLMGGDMERSAAFLNNAANPEEIVDWCFKDINFSVCRVSFDKKQELVEGERNFEFYRDPIIAMKLIQCARPDIKFWATLKSDYDGYGTENNLPDWIYSGGGYNGGKSEPAKINVKKYARFIADYLKLMHAKGVPITYLSVCKEWQKIVDVERERQVIDTLKDLLAFPVYADVPAPLFCGPASWGVKGGTDFVDKVNERNYQNRYHAFCTHDYDDPEESDWRDWIKATGKVRKWHDESNTGGGGPTHGAEPKFTNMLDTYGKRCQWYRQGLQGELFFEQWSRGLNRETRVIYFADKKPGVRLRGYYVMKHFANHTANSRYLVTKRRGLGGVDTMAFRQGDQVTLWIINNSSKTYANVPCEINGATLAQPELTSQFWSEKTPIEGTTATLHSRCPLEFSLTIQAESLTALTFTAGPTR